MNITYWKHQHNKSNQLDQILKICEIYLSEIMTSAHFWTASVVNLFYKNLQR